MHDHQGKSEHSIRPGEEAVNSVIAAWVYLCKVCLRRCHIRRGRPVLRVGQEKDDIGVELYGNEMLPQVQWSCYLPLVP